MKCIKYNSGYKYQLKETCTVEIEIKPSALIDTEGCLTIMEGYAPH